MVMMKTPAAASRRLLEQIRAGAGAAPSTPQEAPAASVPADRFGSLLTRLKGGLSLRGGGTAGGAIGIVETEDGFILAQCSAGRQPRLEGIRYYALPQGVEPGSAEAMLRLAEVLDVFAADRASMQLWSSLSTDDGEVYFLRLPRVKSGELDTVALLSARKKKNFDPAQSVFDFRVTGECPDKSGMRLAAVGMAQPQSRVTEHRRRFQQAGIHLSGLTDSSLSLYALYASGWLAAPWERTILVEVLRDMTQIVIMSRGAVLMRRVVRTGVSALEESMQEADAAADSPLAAEGVYEIDAAPDISLLGALGWEDGEGGMSRDAEADVPPPHRHAAPVSRQTEDLIAHGPQSEEEAERMRAALHPVMLRLAHQLDRTRAHCVNSGDISSVEGVLLVAPAGVMAPMLAVFEEEMGVPCLPLRLDGDASAGARTDLKELLARQEPSAVLEAIGLALSSAVIPNVLMTYLDRRRAQRHLLLARYCMAGSLLLALGMAAVAVGELAGWRAASVDAAALEAEIAAWPEQFTAETLRREVEALRLLHSRGAALLPRRLPAAIMSELAHIAPASISITEASFMLNAEAAGKMAEKQRSGRRGQAQPDAGKGGRAAMFKGIAYGGMLERETALAEFLGLLEDSPLVTSMNFQKDAATDERVSFTITCRIP